LAALSYAFTSDTRSSSSVQTANQNAQRLYVQANNIRAAVQECVLKYPGGGGDLNGDNTIDSDDNPNSPYPLDPDTADAVNPAPDAGDSLVRNLTCMTGSGGCENIYQGANNWGRLLPPVPPDYSDWVYKNDADGVDIQTTGSGSASNAQALSRLVDKFGGCQAELDFDGCGATCLTVWISRASCP